MGGETKHVSIAYYFLCAEINIVIEITADSLRYFIRHPDFQPLSLSASAIQAGKRIHWHISGSHIWPNELKQGFLDETPGKDNLFQNLVLGKLDIHLQNNEVSQGKDWDSLIKNTFFLHWTSCGGCIHCCKHEEKGRRTEKYCPFHGEETKQMPGIFYLLCIYLVRWEK